MTDICIGEIDLNRENTDDLSDIVEYHSDVGYQETDENSMLSNAETADQPVKEIKQLDQQSDETEEGEISDDYDQVFENSENCDTVEGSERDESSLVKSEQASASSVKPAATSFVKWPFRTNGEAKQTGWSWRPEASSVSGQPDKFYQIAWAKGVQGNPKDSPGESPVDEASIVKGRNSGDADSLSSPLHRSASWSGNKDIEQLSDRKSGWIVGDRGMEYVSFLRSNDGYIYLQNGGERPDGRHGKDQSVKERLGLSKNMGNKLEEKYKNPIEERSSFLEKEYQKWPDAPRYPKYGRKRYSHGQGELEEGEIEGKQGNLAGKFIIESDKQTRHVKSRDRKPMERSSSQQSLKGRRDIDPHGTLSDTIGERFLAECAELVRNVSVKDAQRCFVAVCKQLRRAIKILDNLSRSCGPQFMNVDGHQRRILALTRDVFSGIRATYAVHSTAIGREQEQGTDAFPRLLGLARNRCQSLFTPKQIQELDSMIPAIRYQNVNRGNHIPKLYRKEFSSERAEDKDAIFGESSCNTLTTQLESDSSTDLSANGGVGAEQKANPAGGLQLSSANNSLHLIDNDMAGSMGLGGWISSSLDHTEAPNYGFSKEIAHNMTSIASNASDFQDAIGKNYVSHGLGVNRDAKRASMSEREGQIFQGRNHTIDPVKALTSYHEKFAGKSNVVCTRLPSPTPSDEDHNATTHGDVENCGSISSSADVQGLSKWIENLQDSQQPTSVPGKLLSDIVPHGEEDKESEQHQSKLLVSKKSRDPRRRLTSLSSEAVVLSAVANESLNNISNDVVGSQHLCQDKSLSREEPDLAAMVGGWLSEQQYLPDEVPSMEGDGEVLHTSMGSFDESSQRKRQHENLSQEIPVKRLKPLAGVKEGDNMLHLQSVVSADDLKQKLVDEKASLLMTKIMSSAVEPSTEISKLRMKPRDPRRVLLESTIEKSKNQEVASVKDDTFSLIATATNALMQSRAEGTISNVSAAEKQPVFVPTRNDTSHILEGPGKTQEMDTNTSLNRPEDSLRVSKTAGIATKVPTTKVINKLDLNANAPAPPLKHQEVINHWDNLEPLLEGLDENQKQAVRQERARRIKEQNRMFAARKLCLVLDLDHTLLNSAKFTEVEEEWEAKLRVNEMTERTKFAKEGNKRELYRFPHMGMWTKLRPGIWNFLARASLLYELHVYTMGNKAYATEMAKLLDPTGVLFAGRVISKGDEGDVVDGDERLPKSKDLDGVLGMESAVVIIDDSARVWPHHRHNLIVVERYMYFPCSRKQFGLPGPSLLEVGHDEREQDGMLASALMVIEKIHYNFFCNPRLHEIDVRDILAKEQKRVLAGCKLIFSRVFPQGEIQPHLHPLWQLAEQFGAVCSMAMDESVTHVVALSLGTDKVNWALSTGRFVVRPSWVEASTILYRRANERDFLVLP